MANRLTQIKLREEQGKYICSAYSLQLKFLYSLFPQIYLFTLSPKQIKGMKYTGRSVLPPIAAAIKHSKKTIADGSFSPA